MLCCKNCHRIFPRMSVEQINKLSRFTNPYIKCTCPDCAGCVEKETAQQYVQGVRMPSKSGRHHNSNGLRQIKKGSLARNTKRLAERLGIPYRNPTKHAPDESHPTSKTISSNKKGDV